MTNRRSWESAGTHADSGYMHEESMENLMVDAYDLILGASTIEDQTKYINAIFNNISYAEALNKDLFRGYVRSEYSLGASNYLTRSCDGKSGERWEVFADSLRRIIAHDEFTDTMSAILAWYLVSSGSHTMIPDTVGIEVCEDFAAHLQYFASQYLGNANSDDWNYASARLPKWHIYEYLGCSATKVANHDWILRKIIIEALEVDDEILQ